MPGILSLIGIDPISAIVGGISAINDIRLGNIEEKAQLEEVLEELKFNLKIIKDDYLENEISIEVIIEVLKISKLESAERARKRKKLDFNKIRPGRVHKASFVNEHQIKYYSEFDTEQIFLKLREKIIEIKKSRSIYFKRNKWSDKINPKSRMNTIEALFILLSNHISMKEANTQV